MSRTLTRQKRTSDEVRKSNADSLAKARKIQTTLGKHRAKSALGIVEDSESFTIDAFCERIGCTRSALTEMRKRGLVVRANGGKRVISGKDYNEYIKNLPVADLN